MKSQANSFKGRRLPVWRRCVAYFTTLMMFLQVLVPSVASASTLLTDAVVESALNSDPQFVRDTSGRFTATPFLTVSNPYYSIDTLYQCLFDTSKASLVGPKMVPVRVDDITVIIPTYERPTTVGSSFVQARYVRQQILGLLRRHLINSDSAAYANEAKQLQTLYNNACEYARNNPHKKYGVHLGLSREDAPKDMIWPEVRIINGKPLAVPMVYLTAQTIEQRRVVDQTVEFNGSAVFRAVDIQGSTLRFGRNGFLQVTENIVNNGGRIVGSDDLTLLAGGAFVNLSGVVQAEGDLTVAAQHIESRTLVHRYELGQAQERFGEIAEINATTGDVTFRSYGDIILESATVSAGENITFQADGNIRIGGRPIVNTTEGARDGWREYSASSVEYLQSRLSAGDTIRLIAGNEILIDGAELISSRGHIELLAQMGITVQDQTNVNQYARRGTFGSTSVEESAYKTVAMRALLDAGKGIIIHSELGDINLKAVDIRSQEGTHVTAQNGQVNLMVTTENDHYSYSSVKEDLFTTTTINRGRANEDVLHTTVVGGLKVDALKGLNVEYRGQFDEQGNALDLDTQIEALGQMPGLEWMADARAQHPDADWQAIEAKYEEWNERSRSLSPAFAAVVAIAVAIVAGPYGAGFASTIGAGAATGAAASLSGVVVAAGATSFMTQAAMAFANGAVNGDIGGAMEDFASDDTLRSVGIAMITAGAMHSVNADIFDIGVEGSNIQSVADLQFNEQVLHAVTSATVNAGTRTIIEGGNFDGFRDSFVQSLASTGINRLGDYMAGEIGDAFNVDDPDAMQTALRYISHAGAGCVIGIASANVNEDEPNNEGACAASAGGAVIGELVASVASTDEEIDAIKGDIDAFMGENGEQIADWELEGLSPADIKERLLSNDQFAADYNRLSQLRRNGANLARLGAAIAAFTAGADASGIDLAADASSNAINNNARFLQATGYNLLAAIDHIIRKERANEFLMTREGYQHFNESAQDRAARSLNMMLQAGHISPEEAAQLAFELAESGTRNTDPDEMVALNRRFLQAQGLNDNQVAELQEQLQIRELAEQSHQAVNTISDMLPATALSNDPCAGDEFCSAFMVDPLFQEGSGAYEQVAQDNGLLDGILEQSAPVLISVADHMETFAEVSESDWRVKYSLMALEIVAGPLGFVLGQAIEQTPIGDYIDQGTALAFDGLANHIADNPGFTREDAGKIVTGALGIIVAITAVVSVVQAIDSIKDISKLRKYFVFNGKIPVWSGSGPAKGIFGLNASSVSNKAVMNFSPQHDAGVEFIFDTKSNTFLLGASGEFKHRNLADAIDSNYSDVVAGIFRRGNSNEILTDEQSGTFWKNWSNENRQQFIDAMQRYGIEVSHSP